MQRCRIFSRCATVATTVFLCFAGLASIAAEDTELARAAALDQQVFQLYTQGRYADAVLIAKDTLAIREKALGPDHPGVAQSLNNLAALYRSQGRYTDAEPLFKRSLALLSSTPPTWRYAKSPEISAMLKELIAVAEERLDRLERREGAS